ncbi:MurR/RpiR family transcriptional regulator [Pectobacterium brasiliense]|uniref:MurR/RpiR family transcriptional regulator n=1 Tax=Pectobacterium TaxID=122277 RepID=UPI00094B5033|nr:MULTISPECIES: MurR/RpiR family transcriptional regulator [Pectobacterium]MBN3097664.1 MurR/RpiR family transcriptional regulator [Pectobacterium brasiliense]MBN3163621.1 MurR/RpiR family transcriptional regulator [Pectobacterium brasiliense]MBN3183651.1 MurR/RpiR family transcriptional regulator [Pectobacterium brasiliense]MDG0796744.1 MurR/RpiR family transcriptional regulator [Pectobacterium punjabense]PPE61160.1 putative HTH-type transcriptional regulator YbbH [Pectobacterium brasiliense
MFEKDRVKNFSGKEMEVYDFVIKNHAKIPFMTIREFSSLCGYSTTVIIKFCHKLGCGSYKEFKNKLNEHFKNNDFSKGKIFSEELLGFFRVSNNLELGNSINDFYTKINNSQAVLFIGLGTSGILSEYSARVLSNVGITAHFINDPGFPIDVNFYKNWLVVFLSVSGETPEVVGLARRFTFSGINTMCITSNPSSSIVTNTLSSISYNMKQTKLNDDYNITSQIPVLYIVETICRMRNTP